MKATEATDIIGKQQQTEIRVGGKTYLIPFVTVAGRTVITQGRVLKIARVKDEELIPGDTVLDPPAFLRELKAAGTKADLFTFAQRVPETSPKHSYCVEWDNAAVVPITTFDEWWNGRVKPDVRKAVRKAEKLGVVTKCVPFDDHLVRGIVEIYAEDPIRQGKRFVHYQKPFEVVKHECSTYLDQCDFIAAYDKDDLLGFIKLAYVGNIASTIHVISKKSAYEKKATNALIAKTVEICAHRKVTHLTYGSFSYHGRTSSLSEFKLRNGFEEMRFPRYYVPLTLKGRCAVLLKVHHDRVGFLPPGLLNFLSAARARFMTAVIRAKNARSQNGGA